MWKAWRRTHQTTWKVTSNRSETARARREPKQRRLSVARSERVRSRRCVHARAARSNRTRKSCQSFFVPPRSMRQPCLSGHERRATWECQSRMRLDPLQIGVPRTLQQDIHGSPTQKCLQQTTKHHCSTAAHHGDHCNQPSRIATLDVEERPAACASEALCREAQHLRRSGSAPAAKHPRCTCLGLGHAVARSCNQSAREGKRRNIHWVSFISTTPPPSGAATRCLLAC